MKDKVIFLDFDGVLNSVRSAAAYGRYPWSVDLENLYLFDIVAINLIRKICKEYDVDIVLSSTWRKTNRLEVLADCLDLPIVDKTPSSLGSRGDEIQKWLNAHPKITNYCIIDDDANMLESQKSRFVKVCPYNGFSWDNYNQTLIVLGINK